MKGLYTDINKIFESLNLFKRKGYLSIGKMVSDQGYIDNPDLWDNILNIIKVYRMKVQIIPGGYVCDHVLRHMHYLGIPVHHTDGKDYPIPMLNWDDFTFDEWRIISIYLEGKVGMKGKWACIYRYVLRSMSTTDIVEKFIYQVFMEMLHRNVLPKMHFDLEFITEYQDRQLVYTCSEKTSLKHLVHKVVDNTESFTPFQNDNIISEYKSSLELFISYIHIIIPIVNDYVHSVIESFKCDDKDKVITMLKNYEKDSSFYNKLNDLLPERFSRSTCSTNHKPSSKEKAGKTRLPSKTRLRYIRQKYGEPDEYSSNLG